MRRAAILVTCLAMLFAGCSIYLGDDDEKKHRPSSGVLDGGYGDETPDAGCGGGNHGDADGGFVPDAGFWPDGGYDPVPDASPGW